MGPELRACESVSDVVQSVCVELLQRGRPLQWRGRESFRHWLFVTALNKVKQHLRHHRIRRRDLVNVSDVDRLALSESYAPLLPPDLALENKEMIERLEAAIDALPERYAEIITLHRIAGIPYATLAAERGCTEAALRQLLFRALARLATLLDAA
jgi:RNA polymerase sigma-70 factor (ECF subfamily)